LRTPTLSSELLLMLLAKDCKITIAWSANDLPLAWGQLAVPYDVFLTKQYMTALESAAPEGMDFAYAMFWSGTKLVGRAYFQVKHFDAAEHIKDEPNDEKESCFFSAISKWARKWVSRRVKSDVLICGNLLTTGEHHFQFEAGLLDTTNTISLIQDAIAQIIETSPRKISPFVLIKDIIPAHTEFCAQLSKEYTEFEIQPNMVIDVAWPDTASYLSAMSTRYRTRYKRARKKMDGITHSRLTLAQLVDYKDDMYALYQSVATNVGFNMVDLHPGYLLALAEALGDEFEVYAYFHEGRMCAFYTLIHNGTEMDAHFIGFDRSMNHDYQIYLNLLYEIVERCMACGKKRIVFARTALEIKSTVGATPERLHCYLNHAGTITNMLTPHVVEYIKPVEVWQQRHPFKEEES
jgi:Acetyltransferase (GNAT) domain